MFFVFQKIIWFLIIPPSCLLVLIVAGLFVMERNARAARLCIISGVTLLYLLSLGHVADLILKPLEKAYPPLLNGKIAADAVVVPGGGSVDLSWLGAEPVPNAETMTRLTRGVQLAKQLNASLVLTGGNGEPFSTAVRDADAMARAALRMGTDSRALIVESRSRNTLENSHAVRNIVTGDRIVLATSAYYMRRAVVMFEKRGFTVIPAPVYYMTQTRKFNLSSLVPGASNLARSAKGIAEWISILWWRLRGEI